MNNIPAMQSTTLDSIRLIAESSQTSPNPIKALPTEVAKMIFSHLGDHDCTRAMLVCRDWYAKVKASRPLQGMIKLMNKSGFQLRKEETCKPYQNQYPQLEYQIRQPLDIVYIEFPPSSSKWISFRQAAILKAKCFSMGIPSKHLEEKKVGDILLLQLNNEAIKFQVIS